MTFKERVDNAVTQLSWVYSFTKLSPIVLLQKNSQEGWVSWAELLLLGQNLSIFRFFSAKNYFH